MNDESGRESPGMLGCADGRDEDRDQFLYLGAQVGELAWANDCSFLEQVKPVKGFVKFLYGDLQLTDKLSSRTSPARLAIMRADGRAAAQHLLAKHLGNCRLRQRCVQTNNPQRKSLRSLLQVRLFASHNFLRLSVPSQFIIHHSSFIVHRSSFTGVLSFGSQSIVTNASTLRTSGAPVSTVACLAWARATAKASAYETP